MDTISRENNSYLPVAAVIVGALALVLSVVALVKVSSVDTKIDGAVTPLRADIDATAGQVRNATSSASNAISVAERASSGVSSLQRSMQDAFTQVGQELGNIRGEMVKVQETRVAPRPTNNEKPAGPVVAGPGEYVVKSGDTGYKIAQANGVSVADLQAVNPGVSWTGLKVGQKIKLPAKK